MDPDLLFEKLLDNLELYFDLKHDLKRKVRVSWAEGSYDVHEIYWQEYDTLDNLRMLARRALDEYVAGIGGSHGPSHEGREPQPG